MKINIGVDEGLSSASFQLEAVIAEPRSGEP